MLHNELESRNICWPVFRPQTTGGDLPPGTVTNKSRILSRKNHNQENPRINKIEIIVCIFQMKF